MTGKVVKGRVTRKKEDEMENGRDKKRKSEISKVNNPRNGE